MSGKKRRIFIHGLEGSSQGVKARRLRDLFPDILTPDFEGSLNERMSQLAEILGDSRGWWIIGSSFGGLMAAIYTCLHPSQVDKLILLAPALIWPDFASSLPDPVSVPVVVYHGSRDEIISLSSVRDLSEKVFLNLDFRVVDDDHGLYKTVHSIDWHDLLGN